MNLKLFVGGFNQNTTEADVRETFRPYGRVVSVVIVKCNRTNVSKGYGFFTVDNINTYQKILDTKKFDINGRTVEVNTAVKPNTHMPGDLLSKGFRKLFVGGLNGTTTQEDLTNYFSTFGAVINSYIIYDPVTESSRGFGYVEMQTVDAAENILSQETHTIGGRTVTVANHKRGFKTCLKLERRIAAVQAKRIRKQKEADNGLEESAEHSKVQSNSQNSQNLSQNDECSKSKDGNEPITSRQSLMEHFPEVSEKLGDAMHPLLLVVSKHASIQSKNDKFSSTATAEENKGFCKAVRARFYNHLLQVSQNIQARHEKIENVRFNIGSLEMNKNIIQKVLLRKD